LLGMHLEIIRIVVFQQLHENIDPALEHLASSKPVSARLEASMRSLSLTASQTPNAYIFPLNCQNLVRCRA
jgi:hypothetical protein